MGLSPPAIRLSHLIEMWRKAVDSGLVVGVACVDFKKAFDSVSHAILEEKLKHSFGFEGNLLAWVRSYMNRRKQFTIVNGNVSTKLPIKLPHLGPILFVLFNNDTTPFCIGRTADEDIKSLNLALQELYTWCITNILTPHPKKSEALLISRT